MEQKGMTFDHDKIKSESEIYITQEKFLYNGHSTVHCQYV